jgi:hypothetical protein
MPIIYYVCHIDHLDTLMKRIISVMLGTLAISGSAIHAEGNCDDPVHYRKGFLNKNVKELAPRADIREVDLASNYARAYYSDAEINAEIKRRFLASQGNVEKDRNIRLLLSYDGYRDVSEAVIDSGRAQFPNSSVSEEAIVAVIEITDLKPQFLRAYDAYQAALQLPPDQKQEAIETHRQVRNNLTGKMDVDENIREEPSNTIKEISREKKIEDALETMDKLGHRWLCAAYTTGLPDRIAEAVAYAGAAESVSNEGPTRNPESPRSPIAHADAVAAGRDH